MNDKQEKCCIYRALSALYLFFPPHPPDRNKKRIPYHPDMGGRCVIWNF
ncbi:hypothetical protein HCH_02805 [Hahella chejuensis KCTC 2396]|uniref:Uncharacterized protein n=1 Tax=Hahella chejuensis (strain KCTC 2396) TaxID=349521 RepID=Q2SIE1_HAHCH|nr:hypothetical protein HCH_02805 [Hahella chejuensis KCTC 2396]